MSRRQTAGAPDHDLGTRAWRRSSRSGCEQLVFALHQLADFLERLVERAGGNMGIGGIDRDAGPRAVRAGSLDRVIYGKQTLIGAGRNSSSRQRRRLSVHGCRIALVRLDDAAETRPGF